MPLVLDGLSGIVKANMADDAVGLNELDDIEIFKGVNQALSANGYQKFPGGLIVQWGAVGSISIGGSAVVTFPIAFPNSVFAVTTGLLEQAASDHVKVAIKDLLNSGFVMLGDGTTGTVPGARWIAIGY